MRGKRGDAAGRQPAVVVVGDEVGPGTDPSDMARVAEVVGV